MPPKTVRRVYVSKRLRSNLFLTLGLHITIGCREPRPATNFCGRTPSKEDLRGHSKNEENSTNSVSSSCRRGRFGVHRDGHALCGPDESATLLDLLRQQHERQLG